MNRALCCIPLCLFSVAGSAFAQQLAIEFKAGVTLGASAVDQNGTSFTVGGMSGIVRLQGSEYAAIQNNSNKIACIDIQLDADGSITAAAIKPGVGGGLSLSQSSDFEDIAFPGVARDRVLISEESSPEIREYNFSTGAFVRALPRPAIYANRRSNFGFESLSLNRTQSSLWTCNEEAITVDGPLSTSNAGTLVRILKYNYTASTPIPVAAYSYRTDPVHGTFVSGSRSGVSQIVALPNGKLLVLERSFALTASVYQTRIYEVDVSAATDVLAFPTTFEVAHVQATKRLLYSGSQTNLEGLCLGPKLAAGGYALLGFVDDADFVRFAEAYNLLLDTTGDFNLDQQTDDADFVVFAAAYNAFLCL